jgi:hypothetical protein
MSNTDAAIRVSVRSGPFETKPDEIAIDGAMECAGSMEDLHGRQHDGNQLAEADAEGHGGRSTVVS